MATKELILSKLSQARLLIQEDPSQALSILEFILVQENCDQVIRFDKIQVLLLLNKAEQALEELQLYMKGTHLEQTKEYFTLLMQSYLQLEYY
jgi:hypothetical protein